jgi:RNA recognition motif-containing protein
MTRGSYSAGKRQRDSDKARKKREKAERRMRRRREGPGEVPISSADEVTGDLQAAEEAVREARAAQGDKRTIPCRLFVGSLSWGTSEEDLRTAFGEYGKVADAVVVQDRDTGRSRGFGFVTFEDRKDASRAIGQLDGAELDGRTIVVKVATERQR